MTSFERARRNQAVVNARLRGVSERRVAEMYGVSERHVRRVFREYRESCPALHERDPVEALAGTLIPIKLSSMKRWRYLTRRSMRASALAP